MYGFITSHPCDHYVLVLLVTFMMYPDIICYQSIAIICVYIFLRWYVQCHDKEMVSGRYLLRVKTIAARDLPQRLFDNHTDSITLYLVDARPQQRPFCLFVYGQLPYLCTCVLVV